MLRLILWIVLHLSMEESLPLSLKVISSACPARRANQLIELFQSIYAFGKY